MIKESSYINIESIEKIRTNKEKNTKLFIAVPLFKDAYYIIFTKKLAQT